MSFKESRAAQLFPTLNSAQIQVARRFASADAQRCAPGEVLVAVGEKHPPAFLVLAGEIIISNGAHPETLITRHATGAMTGEISQLAGRPSLVELRAGHDGCEVLPFDAAHLRALLIGSAELGELLMRAFILRRVSFIADESAGTVLVGHANSPAMIRLEGFLSRNGQPYSVMDHGEKGGAPGEKLGLTEDDLPVALCPGGEMLRQPTEAQLAGCLGITPDLDPDRLYDVAIVGAGPAGLAAAVYAGSEGLSVIVLDARGVGGQAGASARIENYLGFPTGITGQALMGRAFTQAVKFGVEIAVPLAVERLECRGEQHEAGEPFTLFLSNQTRVLARSVVIASGARYRKPDIAGLDSFEGAGVSYWASPVEARLCDGEDVVLVGGGNSAGQAVAFLAPKVRKLHLVIRSDGLAASMSRYLIDRIEALPNVELHTRTEVATVVGDKTTGLQAVRFRNRDTGACAKLDIRYLFLFVGADPNTSWLAGCMVQVDRAGFILTGSNAGLSAPQFSLQTSVPGIFAIGDVRAGSTKRIAASVGEGAAAVAQIHTYLAA
jgi:thioredoxin reductase (NADPH)